MKNGELNYIDLVRDYEDRVGISTDNYEYELRNGRGRYNKIVASDKVGSSLRAVAFIDKQTSHLFRAASWSQPARTRIA